MNNDFLEAEIIVFSGIISWSPHLSKKNHLHLIEKIIDKKTPAI